MSTKFVKRGPKADDYKVLSQKEHIILKPGMYIGDKKPNPREVYIFKEDKMQLSTITTPEGVERLFIEILSNAADNVNRSREMNVKPGDIKVETDGKYISITNGGVPIPVEEKKGTGQYVPEIIFGNLMSGSNFGDHNTGAGTHGLGAKLANVFSTHFKVEIGDANNHKEYIQEWRNHMDIKEKAKITSYAKKKSYVKITYTIDFPFFSYEKGDYDLDTLALFMRHCLETSFTAQVPVMFNTTKYDVSKIEDFTSLYFPEVKNYLVHKEEGLQVCILDTPNEGNVISFVNGISTPDGGVHVEAVLKKVGQHLISYLLKECGAKLTMKHIKPHLSVVINYRALNPTFSSQTKSKLSSPTPKVEFTEKELKGVNKWGIMDVLLKTVDNKNQALLNKTNGKKRRHIILDKLSDANWAGGPKSSQCTLMLFEGNSASGYSTFMLPYIQGGRDTFGIYPLKGKPLNTMQADFIQISNNKEIIGIKQALGLTEGTDYTDEKAFKSLRYGKVVIAADADDDGKHIIALIILFFHVRFPSLLKRGYVNILRTPIVRVTKGNTRIPFLSLKKFEEWRRNNPSGWSIHYYKGLGTSEEGDVKEDMQKLDDRLINFVFDDKAADKFIMAFAKEEVEKRKEWFQRMCKEDSLGIEELKKLDISLFLEQEFGTYVLANMKRSIPSMFDGLKETPRKLVYVASLEWNIGSKTYAKKKVPQLSGLIVDRAAYVHGETNANKAVLHMARDFVGSNNAPIFYPSGSFGTRVKGGQDASDPRYLFTHPHVFMRFFCHPDDQPILQYRVEEGKQVEPKCYYPPLPFSLINGVSGIATGYSTFIPNHNPLDLIAWVRAKIQNKKLPPLVPWYKGFTGRIILQDRNSKFKLDKDIDDSLDLEEKGEEENKEGGDTIITYGKYEEKGDTVVVTELPVGRWSDNYENWLKTLIQEKKINDYRTMCTAHNVYFEIKGFANPSYKNLRLVKRYSLNNMNLLDGEGRPKKYDKVSDIMEDFYTYRLRIYGLRKVNLIKQKEEEIERLGAKERYVACVNEGKIEIRNVKKEVVIQAMEENKVSRSKEIINDLFSKTKASAFTEEERKKLQNKVAKVKEELKELEKKEVTAFWLEDLQEFEEEYNKYLKKK